jgi:Fis family transcriptional regulator
MSQPNIEASVREAVNQYFQDLGGEEPHALHAMVIEAVEKPLLEAVLQRAEGNQSKAAEWLGINRNTLRRKLSLHHIPS